MISYEEASQIIFDTITDLGTVSCPIEDAIGKVLSSDIVSPIDVSPFRNSAMDGFAVRAEWFDECSEQKPITIPIADVVFAGDTLKQTQVSDRQVIKVMTGAPVPQVFDSVVPFEHTTYDEHTVTFTKPVVTGQNLRQPGEDITRNQQLFPKGYRLRQLDIGILASIGLREVMVYRQPEVLIASTGDELIEPGTPLTDAHIYNSNTYTIAAMIQPFCHTWKRTPLVTDDTRALHTALKSDADVVITTGGVSAGERDLVLEAAESCGWEHVFHKIRIKPGKPVLFARRDKQVLFGLPGNPLSTAVTCAVFVIPALKKMCGYHDYTIQPVPAKLAPDSIRKSGRMLIWPGMIQQNGNEIIATFANKKSSAALSALTGTDGLIFQTVVENINGEPPQVAVVRWEQILNR